MSSGSAEFNALLKLSAKVGSDPALVQAAGGNTSIKLGDVLWIKASGTWLMNALKQNIMVPVQLSPLLEALQRNDPAAEKAQSFVVARQNPEKLRPSIETTVHAVFPQRVVVHVHCVETIALAIKSNAKEILTPLLNGFNWRFIPYAKPGLNLSRAISASLYQNNQPADVAVLGNHGLVVAGETVTQVSDLLSSVCQALRQPVRSAPEANVAKLQQLSEGSDYELPADIQSHAVALDETALAIARKGSLYPDHVIFLGEGSVIAQPGETPDQVVQRLAGANQPPPVSIVFPGHGVLMKKSCSKGAHAMARCLSDVCVRVSEARAVNYLTAEQNDELLNWDAEQYRQKLNKQSNRKKPAGQPSV